MTHIPGSGTGGSVVLLHPNMIPSLPATLNALNTFAAVSDPYLRQMVDLRNATKVRVMAAIGDALVAASAVRIQFHTGGDPAVVSGDAGWTELVTTAGSHLLATMFYAAEAAVPSGARINHCLVRAGLFSGNGLVSPTLTACILNFYA